MINSNQVNRMHSYSTILLLYCNNQIEAQFCYLESLSVTRINGGIDIMRGSKRELYWNMRSVIECHRGSAVTAHIASVDAAAIDEHAKRRLLRHLPLALGCPPFIIRWLKAHFSLSSLFVISVGAQKHALFFFLSLFVSLFILNFFLSLFLCFVCCFFIDLTNYFNYLLLVFLRFFCWILFGFSRTPFFHFPVVRFFVFSRLSFQCQIAANFIIEYF